MADKNNEPKNEVALFIHEAIEKGLGVETMEKLFALREKVKAEQAREAYLESLAVFQSNCPVITKTKKVLNKDGQSVRYRYAPLDTIAEQIKKPLAEQGLSYSWEVENTPGLIKATAKVTHKLGHSETSSFAVPIDTEGYYGCSIPCNELRSACEEMKNCVWLKADLVPQIEFTEWTPDGHPATFKVSRLAIG